MTNEDLLQIERRASAASPGPWWVVYEGVETSEGAVVVQDMRHGRTINDSHEDDQEFIAHARADVDALVAEVKRLRAILSPLVAMADERAALNVEMYRAHSRSNYFAETRHNWIAPKPWVDPEYDGARAASDKIGSYWHFSGVYLMKAAERLAGVKIDE